MLCTPWMVILCGPNIIKISFENIDFRAAQGEKLHKQVVYRAIIGGNSHFASLARVVTGSQQG